MVGTDNEVKLARVDRLSRRCSDDHDEVERQGNPARRDVAGGKSRQCRIVELDLAAAGAQCLHRHDPPVPDLRFAESAAVSSDDPNGSGPMPMWGSIISTSGTSRCSP